MCKRSDNCSLILRQASSHAVSDGVKPALTFIVSLIRSSSSSYVPSSLLSQCELNLISSWAHPSRELIDDLARHSALGKLVFQTDIPLHVSLNFILLTSPTLRMLYLLLVAHKSLCFLALLITIATPALKKYWLLNPSCLPSGRNCARFRSRFHFIHRLGKWSQTFVINFLFMYADDTNLLVSKKRCWNLRRVWQYT